MQTIKNNMNPLFVFKIKFLLVVMVVLTQPCHPQPPSVRTARPVEDLQQLGSTGARQIIIEPGRYLLPPDGLRLEGIRDLVLTATGVTFVATDPQRRALVFRECENITVRGLTIDYDPLPFTQATIVAIDEEAFTFDIEVHDGYPDLDHIYRVNRFHLFKSDQHAWKLDAPDYYVTRVERLEPRRGRVWLRRDASEFAHLETGDRVVFNIRKAAALVIGSFCKDIHLEDVTIHAAPGVAILVRFAETAGTLKRVRVVPGPLPEGAIEPRLISTNADAYNVAYTRKGPQIEDCEFAFMGDDAINLHGVTLPVLDWEDSRTLITMRPHNEPWDRLFRPGDELRFLRAPSYALLEKVELAEIERIDPPDSFDWHSFARKLWPSVREHRKASFFRIRLQQDVELTKEDLFFESFPTSAPNYLIQNNLFRNHRGRGLRLMTGNGVVRGNHFERIKDSAISIGPEFEHWREAGWVENLTVEGNRIREVGMGQHTLSNGAYTLGAISVFARVSAQGEDTEHYPGNQGIRIIGNDIAGSNLDGIHIYGASSVLVKQNRIREVCLNPNPSAGKNYGLTSGHPITVLQGEVDLVDNDLQ